MFGNFSIQIPYLIIDLLIIHREDNYLLSEYSEKVKCLEYSCNEEITIEENEYWRKESEDVPVCIIACLLPIYYHLQMYTVHH